MLTPLAWIDKHPGVTIKGIEALRRGLHWYLMGAITVALLMAIGFT
ncbi:MULTISPECIES: hypothetical protein [Halomonadaceae]|nr:MULTISPECIES: hypothetical protein [Halomonas]